GPLTRLLNQDVSVSENTVIQGTFTSGYTSIVRAYGAIDSLWYSGALFVNNELDLSASKISDSTNVLGVISITSQGQQFSPAFKSKGLLLEGIWNRNHIDFSLDADQDGQPNYIRLKGGVDFMSDSTVLAMQPSELKLLGRDWRFTDDNRTVVRGSEVRFHDLKLANNEQYVGLNGLLSEDPTKILSLTAEELDLSLLDVLTKKKFKGILDAKVDVSSFYTKASIQNDVNIRGLTVDDFLVGDITGKNEWDTARHKFVINLAIDQQKARILNLLGEYDPLRKDSPLNLLARLEGANLNLLEPFLGDIFSRMAGTVSGDFRITGELEEPVIAGEGDVADGQLMVNYLKTLYQFTGKVGLTPTSIYFKDIELTDSYRNKGKLNGAINHLNFNSMSIVLDASFINLQVLNTSTRDNTLFFGQAYATGTMEMRGPISNLRIYSTATTQPNTKIYIPVSGTSSTDQKDFITFDSFTDTTKTKTVVSAVSKRVSLTGVTLDLDLDVTPDAYCEIIFDVKSGDIIRGRGNGDIKIQVDSKGDFNMFGPFVFTEGRYNFTLYDIINKEFEIKPGSSITWTGDPYEGNMDIDASYNQLASLYSLYPANDSKDPTQDQALRRKYPIQVLLMIDGPMLSPNINFDIIAKDLPQVVTTSGVNLDLMFTAFRARLDEQELKRQVFSLIVLRRFSPPESFNTSGSVASSLSELLSNQLSYWMSQVDENLELDVDVASMDQESFNTFQLRFSYTFLNGRLRVTGDGTYYNQSQVSQTQATPTNIAGDWTVDYKLTADGKLRVKMYSRTNINPIPTAAQQTYMTTGASIVHTQSFDELRDIFASSRKQRRREAERAKANTEATKREDGSD
ncbi:MAG TPA: translocation/assembly module TamB domain-containing protein, partial [Chryseolinea sp.]|nr:translocation/assembly module TamB domain-containing protein [Chryseolinea sp.]